jgi:putative hydrolase of the HAD superfamily
MAKAVLFDFGGTLDADGCPWGERLYEAYRRAGGRTEPIPFEEAFKRADQLLADVPGVGRLGFRRMVEVQVELLRELLPGAQSLDAGAWTGFFLSAAHEVVSRNRLVLDRLGRRFQLGVVSNFTGNLVPCLRELGVEDCFSVVLDSAVVGHRKPDARIFEAAFSALGRAPEECWMVGDNPLADIEPAARLGCATCWLAPASRPTPAGLRPTRRIASLGELPAVVE